MIIGVDVFLIEPFKELSRPDLLRNGESSLACIARTSGMSKVRSKPYKVD